MLLKGNTFVAGSQWGDESKGKIADCLAAEADIVARAQGGPNAGHTVWIGKDKYVFHLLPCGILHDHCVNIVGNGAVIGVEGIVHEIESLRERGWRVDGKNLLISDRAHLILPRHLAADNANEDSEGNKLGTTRRGVGPAYSEKAARINAMRMGDLIDFSHFREKYARVDAMIGVPEEETNATLDAYADYADILRPHVTDTTAVLHDALEAGKRIVFEGAQGALLDIDFGTYPYVTSSSTTAGGVCTGLGIPPSAVHETLAVVKAYTTRVGLGPFPSEMDDAFGEKVRAAGNEYGATTGRPRRCGWLDMVGLRYSSRINGFTQLAVSKMDVLDGLETLRICVGYRRSGEAVDRFPAQLSVLEECEPVYEEMPGWSEDTSAVREYDQLPANARAYLERIETLLDTPVTCVSVGKERSATMARI